MENTRASDRSKSAWKRNETFYRSPRTTDKKLLYVDNSIKLFV